MKLVQWVVDGWSVTFGTAMRGLGGAAAPRPLLTVRNVIAHPPMATAQITNYRIATDKAKNKVSDA